jgi:hypothetical protein
MPLVECCQSSPRSHVGRGALVKAMLVVARFERQEKAPGKWTSSHLRDTVIEPYKIVFVYSAVSGFLGKQTT